MPSVWEKESVADSGGYGSEESAGILCPMSVRKYLGYFGGREGAARLCGGCYGGEVKLTKWMACRNRKWALLWQGPFVFPYVFPLDDFEVQNRRVAEVKKCGE